MEKVLVPAFKRTIKGKFRDSLTLKQLDDYCKINKSEVIFENGHAYLILLEVKYMAETDLWTALGIDKSE
jgi:hypothetical protein